MNKIKMSDVFELPLEREGDTVFAQDCQTTLQTDYSNSNAFDVLDCAVTAINAYDDNQERIAELEAFLNKFVEASEGDTLITVEEAIELQRRAK